MPSLRDALDEAHLRISAEVDAAASSRTSSPLVGRTPPLLREPGGHEAEKWRQVIDSLADELICAGRRCSRVNS